MTRDGRLLARLDAQDAVIAASIARRGALLDGIAARIGDLMAIPRPAALLDRVCHDVVDVCGFSRAMLSRVEGDVWLPGTTTHTVRPAQDGDESCWRGPTEILLDGATPERVAVTGRRARIGASRSGVGYVVAPLAPDDRVVGLLHADHHPTGRPVDAIDRRALELFADGFSRVYERAVLADRLRAQHERLRRAVAATEALSATLVGTEATLDRAGDGAIGPGRAANEAIDATLTSREAEVLSLIARGRSSEEIADLLIVRPETVRSHVTRILRKLGARNRSEAVALYLTRGRPREEGVA